MIIYSMEHFMSFYQMLTLRLIKHKNEKAILIFSSFSDSISLKKHLFDKLKNIGVFDEIISLPFISAKTMKDENLQTEQQIMNKIISTYNPIMESHGVNLHDIKTAYEFYDWNASFAFFMYYYNINFVQLEPMPNSTEFFYHRCVDLLKKDFTTPVYFNLYEKIFRMNEHDKPTGKIMLFSETIFFDNANLTEEEKSFVEYFDFNKNFCLIDESYKQKILSCFNIDINFLKNNSVCILIPNSFHFTWIISQRSEKVIHKLKDALYTDSEYEKIYITLAEYFSHKDNIVMYISHPNYNTSTMGIDTFVNRKIYIFDKNMPVEFLHWIPNFRIKQALSVKTTATQKLTTIIDENIELDWGFVQMYNIMDRLYIIQKIISTLPQSINLHFYAITTEVFEMLYKCHFDNYLEKTFIPLKTCENVMLKNSGVCVVNTRIIEDEPISNQNFILDMLEKSQPNSIVFFTNIFNESAFVPLLLSRKFLLDFIVPIQINRTPLDDGEQVGELGTTAIFAFCKNAETRQYLREIQFSKQLKYLNVLLDVSPISEETAQSWLQQAYNHAVTAAVVHNSNNKIIKQKNDEIQRINEIIQQKDGEIQQKQEEIHQINEIIHLKDNEIHQINEIIHHKNEEIDHLKSRITELETSTSWKITNPLRKLKKILWILTE